MNQIKFDKRPPKKIKKNSQLSNSDSISEIQTLLSHSYSTVFPIKTIRAGQQYTGRPSPYFFTRLGAHSLISKKKSNRTAAATLMNKSGKNQYGFFSSSSAGQISKWTAAAAGMGIVCRIQRRYTQSKWSKTNK
jgi:hypothetical protein